MLHGHEKCIFETPHNEIKCVLSIKESNFNGKMGQNFLISLRSGPRKLTPYPLTVSLTVIYSGVLDDFPYKFWFWYNFKVKLTLEKFS